MTPIDTAISKSNQKAFTLPPTRPSIVHKFIVHDMKGYLILGLQENGSLGELGIHVAKEGSFAGGVLDTFATIFSVALQYGVPLEVLLEKMQGRCFEPLGYTSNPEIKEASSIMDYVALYLRRFIVK